MSASTSQNQRIAVVGLGSMGFGMATSLKRAGHAVTGCDVSADAVARLEGVDGISVVPFNIADVVRHPVVGRIVQAYEGPDA